MASIERLSITILATLNRLTTTRPLYIKIKDLTASHPILFIGAATWSDGLLLGGDGRQKFALKRLKTSVMNL
jgi:hypothetical protein